MRSLSLPRMSWNHCLRGFKGRWEAWQVPKERLGRGPSRSGLTITQTIPMPVLLKVGSGLLDEGSKALDEMEEEARAAPLQVFFEIFNLLKLDLKLFLDESQYRAEMLGSVRQQQSRLAKLRGELQKANRGMNRAPGEGGRDRAGGGQSGPPDQYRQQVLAGTRVLERTGDSLARAQQVFVKHCFSNIKRQKGHLLTIL